MDRHRATPQSCVMDGQEAQPAPRDATGVLAALRRACWLTPARARAYGVILAAGMASVAVVWLFLSHGALDARGKPIGADFAHYWTAGRLALQGSPAAAWDVSALHAGQVAIFGAGIGVTPFLYPPPFLVICVILALLPYGWSLIAWLSVTGAAYWIALRRHLPPRVSALPILAFPAGFVNATHGQNGFLTAALFGAAALAYRRSPMLAGVCLGLLSFKPHLGIAVIVVLLAGRRWRTVFAASLTVLSLYCASLLLVGAEAWLAFLEAASIARSILEQRLIDPEKLASVFSAVLLMGGGPMLGYAVQGIAAVATCVVAARIACKRPGGAGEVSLMVAAVPLCSPYLFDYDLTILALPLAWVFASAQRDGFLAWEKIGLLAAFLVPLLARPIGGAIGVPITPFVAAGLLIVVARRLYMRGQNFDCAQSCAMERYQPLCSPSRSSIA